MLLMPELEIPELNVWLKGAIWLFILYILRALDKELDDEEISKQHATFITELLALLLSLLVNTHLHTIPVEVSDIIFFHLFVTLRFFRLTILTTDEFIEFMFPLPEEEQSFTIEEPKKIKFIEVPLL